MAGTALKFDSRLFAILADVLNYKDSLVSKKTYLVDHTDDLAGKIASKNFKNSYKDNDVMVHEAFDQSKQIQRVSLILQMLVNDMTPTNYIKDIFRRYDNCVKIGETLITKYINSSDIYTKEDVDKSPGKIEGFVLYEYVAKSQAAIDLINEIIASLDTAINYVKKIFTAKYNFVEGTTTLRADSSISHLVENILNKIFTSPSFSRDYYVKYKDQYVPIEREVIDDFGKDRIITPQPAHSVKVWYNGKEAFKTAAQTPELIDFITDYKIPIKNSFGVDYDTLTA
jgi:hypothetical protein